MTAAAAGAEAAAAELTMGSGNKQADAVKYKGVKLQRMEAPQRFVARVSILGTNRAYHLGVFASAEEAAHAADLGHLAMRGRGVKTNFPVEQYTDDDIAAARAKMKEPEKQIKCSQYKGVESYGPGTWLPRIYFSQYRRVHLGVYKDENQAALRYDLGQLFMHGCDVSACKHKLNFTHWSDYSPEQLQAKTRDVGAWITASLVKQACPAAVVQKEPDRRGNPTSLSIHHAGAAAGPIKVEQPAPAAAKHSSPAAAAPMAERQAATVVMSGRGRESVPAAAAGAAAGKGARGKADKSEVEVMSAAAAPTEAYQQPSRTAACHKWQPAEQHWPAAAEEPHPATGGAAAVGTGRVVGVGLEQQNGKQATGVKQHTGKVTRKEGQQRSNGGPATVAAQPAIAAAEQVQDPGGFAAAVAAAKEKLSHAREEREAARDLSLQQLKAARKSVKAAKAELKEAKAAAAAAAEAAQAAESAAATKQAAAAAVGKTHQQHSKPQQQGEKQQQHSRKRLRDTSQLAAAAMTGNVDITKKVKKGGVIPAVAAAAGQGEECQNPNSKQQQQGMGSRIRSNAERPQLQQGLTLVRLADPLPSGKKQNREPEPSSYRSAAASPAHNLHERAACVFRLPAAAAGGGVPTPPCAPVPECKQPRDTTEPAAAAGEIAAKGNKQKRRAAAAADDGGVDHQELPPPEQHQQHEQQQQQQRALLQRIANLTVLLNGGRGQQISTTQPRQWDTHNGLKKRRKISSKTKGSN